MSEEVSNFTDFMALATRTYTDNRNIRYGQHWFNVLYLYRPALANELRSMDIDPFHHNFLTPECVQFIDQRWETGQ